MSGFLYTLLILSIVAALYLYISERWSWKEFHASTAKHPNESIRIFSALQRNGLRCRLQNNKIRHGQSAANWEQTTYVFVHRADINKASKLAGHLVAKAAGVKKAS